MSELTPRTPATPPGAPRRVEDGVLKRDAAVSPAALAKQVLYKAKASCKVGGVYRRAGEVFSLPEFDQTPPFLIRVESNEDELKEKAAPGRRPKAAAPGPMPDELPGVVRD